MVLGQLSAPLHPASEAADTEDKRTSPAAHWRRRRNAVPMPADQAARQGDISTLAFQILGKDAAIDFLNSEHAALGGRPIALAIGSLAGAASVKAELERLAQGEPKASQAE